MTWQQRLNQEKSLFQIYKIARVVAFSKGNVIASVGVFVIAVLMLGINAFTGMVVASIPALQNAINSVADTGFTFTSTMLGFLISGFAIFASISKPDVLIILARTDYKNPRISELQFIFFNFILVFIHYIIFLGACAIIKILSGDSAPLPRGLDLVSAYSEAIGCALTSTLLAALLSWLAFVTLLLKSFIWNLYQSVLITIQIEDLLKQTHRTDDSDCEHKK
ncbi:hypothetical protein [Rhizobium sp. Rhizsp42]|uniref:hypothetical protein n=1 Tax=Rhizobium sp. Rhizsp42 TaxID=3243034 RepID=UPI0039B0834A